MQITFIQHCPACLASGWSEYPAGAKADLVRASELVKVGIAVEGWIKPTPEPVAVEPVSKKVQLAPKEVTRPAKVEQQAPVVNYSAMSTTKVRSDAKKAGVWKRGMKRDAMIAALEDAD